MAEKINDAVDSLPDDPTSTINEVTYKPTTNVGSKRTVSLTNQPTLETPQGNQIQKEPRTTFQGVVVDLGDTEKSPREYKVLRQDLKLGFAYCYGMEAGYNDFQVGNEVTLISTDIQGIWSIIGGAKPLPLPTLTARGAGLGPGEEVDIEWDTVVQQTEFETFTLEDGGITVKCDDEIQLEILFQAVVTSSEPKSKPIISVITDARIQGDYIQFEYVDIEAFILSGPDWVDTIPLTSCTAY